MPALRPYCHPPYKLQSSNYELRMRETRTLLRTRALKIVESLRALDVSDPKVVEMAFNLHKNENAKKFIWIHNAINELALTASKLEPGITRERVNELVEAQNIILEANEVMPKYHHHHLKEVADDQDLNGAVHLFNVPHDDPVTWSQQNVDAPPTMAQVVMAARTRNSLIDIIECLNKPICPRAPPGSVNPPLRYKRVSFRPKLDIRYRVEEEKLGESWRKKRPVWKNDPKRPPPETSGQETQIPVEGLVAESHGSAPASPIHSPALALPRSLITLGHDGADDDWIPPHSPALTLPRSVEKPSATEKFEFSVGHQDDVPGQANSPALELPRSTGTIEIHKLGRSVDSSGLEVTHAGLLKSPKKLHWLCELKVNSSKSWNNLPAQSGSAHMDLFNPSFHPHHADRS